jgi:hypothetical protein
MASYNREKVREAIARHERDRARRVREAVERRKRGEAPPPRPEAKASRDRELDCLRARVANDLTAHPLRRVRLEADLTTLELALKSRTPYRTIQDIERRVTTTPTAKTLRKLAKALGVDPKDIT